MEASQRKRTYIVDIDGTLICNYGKGMDVQLNEPNKLLPGVREAFLKWEHEGGYIVLITGRKSSHRVETEFLLKSLGLYWDQLIMGVSGGNRYLINDCKIGGEQTAYAINVERNTGLKGIDI
jgi:ribonucleotide monophosphatase NagD (HAD superfamily)